MFGTDVWKWRWRCRAANFHRPMSFGSIGKTISCRWSSSWPKHIGAFKDSLWIRTGHRSNGPHWRLRVVMWASSRRATANIGVSFCRVCTNWKYLPMVMLREKLTLWSSNSIQLCWMLHCKLPRYVFRFSRSFYFGKKGIYNYLVGAIVII